MSDAHQEVTETVSTSVTGDSRSIAQMLVDSVVDHAMYLIDLDGVIKSWNAGAERIAAYSAQEIIGSHFSVFYTDHDVRAGEPGRAL